MRIIHATLIATSLSLFLAMPAFADRGDKHRNYQSKMEYKIDKRLDRQFHRIERGIDNERLTYKEAKKLKKKLRKTRRLSREYREDGYLSRREFHHLNRKLDNNSDLIREFTHNGVERYIAYHDEYSKNRHYWKY
ncbi:MAG: hypothetical protein LC541_15070 [Candidatus Thiodiazotropha sp.]|nr:hypothetical protein [Candidatus Thiodiazotropha sp.]MCM8884592.1 hypothetical protein [Candidatus Thiodiazotropha sp.]MCM8920501.1 hypothetical protein [Candidatus Thiodiazotropha sp.]MCU7873874.1 hypothetical protein [Candidatus Thiodiazotropha sp. (ex Lucinoma borealis)]